MRTICFHRCPITKFIVILLTIFSVLHTIIRLFDTSQDFLLMKLLKVLSIPFGTRWMICVTILYQTHHLEKNLSSDVYAYFFLSSSIISCVVSVSIYVSHQSLPSLILQSGSIAYILVGLLVSMTILKSKASHTRRILGIQLSSHIVLVTAVSLLLLISSKALVPIGVGMVSSLVICWTRPLPLPHVLMKTIVTFITSVCEEPAPQVLSGATLSIQRQQRMDLIEGYLLNVQQRRTRGFQHMFRGGFPHRQEEGGNGHTPPTGPYNPTNEQVQQLSLMGFRQEECRHALVAANGNIAVAVQLLTTNRPHP